MKKKVRSFILFALLLSVVAFQFGCEIFDPDFFMKNSYKLTYDFEDQFNVLPSSVSNYEIVSPEEEVYSETSPDDFYLIQNNAELEDFQNNFFKVDLKLEENYFDTGILVIHPKATFAGPIKNLRVFVRNNQLTMKYNWRDGMADCYCYALVVVYLAPENIL